MSGRCRLFLEARYTSNIKLNKLENVQVLSAKGRDKDFCFGDIKKMRLSFLKVVSRTSIYIKKIKVQSVCTLSIDIGSD